MSIYIKKKTKPSMKELLESAGWKKTLEGWVDPVKKDKVTINAAWLRFQKSLTRSQSE